MGSCFIIRKGQQSDLIELRKLCIETITTTCSKDYNEQQIKAWISNIRDRQRWIQLLEKQFILVAQHTNKITGFITLGNRNYIDLLYVYENYQRQRVATKLLTNIEIEAKQLEQSYLTSNVSKTARSFFEHNGFKVQTEQTVNIRGINLINYKMVKPLS
ncbi:GNAT family N-acetyltransferase [Candidatus Nitrosacidococcus sp. I8]|uniref:GNAT family N-acetyltransferase n=1 Tax=Candidatus Nitrosacidococcus sp. I8 TaxID=2942908 RepID=UPI0022263FA0|nr:GNAT family N-acetyltransferase [Candidatus Nitrosacidococcus sp. I8]CAH9019464.1 putative N-acetyltransferase YafP [Candidatus Nitrosacidococcus sp. I8]